MKKFTKVAIIGVATIVLTAFSAPKADNSFEGIITFNISVNMPDNNNPQAAAMMQQGSSLKEYIKGDKMRTEMNMGMMHRVSIIDIKTKEVVTLIDMMGTKYEIKSDPNKPKPNEEKPDIKYLDSTKTIAGYKCNAALVTVTSPKTGEKNSFTIYYTDQLPYNEEVGLYKGLKGFPLQFAMKQRGMTINCMAQSADSNCFPIRYL